MWESVSLIFGRHHAVLIFMYHVSPSSIYWRFLFRRSITGLLLISHTSTASGIGTRSTNLESPETSVRITAVSDEFCMYSILHCMNSAVSEIRTWYTVVLFPYERERFALTIVENHFCLKPLLVLFLSLPEAHDWCSFDDARTLVPLIMNLSGFQNAKARRLDKSFSRGLVSWYWLGWPCLYWWWVES